MKRVHGKGKHKGKNPRASRGQRGIFPSPSPNVISAWAALRKRIGSGGVVNGIRKFISDRLEELGLDRKEVSRRIGRNETYLSQYIVRGSPKELHERDREKLAVILRVDASALREATVTAPTRTKKDVTARDSLIALSPAPLYRQDRGAPVQTVPGSELFGNRPDLPVFGTRHGEQGALVVSDVAVDWVARPAVLLRVHDGYGMIIANDFMAPEHKPGSVALVNPHMPPRVGDSCVFRDKATGGNAKLKEYRGETPTHWKVRQHNPPKDFQLSKSDWPICHKTVGSYFP